MLELVRDLVAHKGHATAALLQAIRANDAAASDADVLALLHHILLANRFWLLTILGMPFVQEAEAAPADSFDDLVARYHRTHEQETEWLSAAAEGALARLLIDPRIPGGRCTVAEAFVQVCLHSQGHRSQCATLLRRHGGVPPTTDFIVWVAGRPEAEWRAPGEQAPQ
ncbi:MAG: DinB family protein [Vicinamibacterales bacterium]